VVQQHNSSRRQRGDHGVVGKKKKEKGFTLDKGKNGGDAAAKRQVGKTNSTEKGGHWKTREDEGTVIAGLRKKAVGLEYKRPDEN